MNEQPAHLFWNCYLLPHFSFFCRFQRLNEKTSSINPTYTRSNEWTSTACAFYKISKTIFPAWFCDKHLRVWKPLVHKNFAFHTIMKCETIHHGINELQFAIFKICYRPTSCLCLTLPKFQNFVPLIVQKIDLLIRTKFLY